MIAAIYVHRAGAYFDIPDVDPWDEARDARKYAGPHAVVAHPPCSRWCALAGLVEAVHGHKRGDDGGTFAHALWAVRQFGGVLEHPAYTDAWPAFGLRAPKKNGVWSLAGDGRGFVAQVEQFHYGHRARKATWLYAVRCELPVLRRGVVAVRSAVWVSDAKSNANVEGGTCASAKKPRLSSHEASHTPDAFRAVLLGMARSVVARSQRVST